MPPKPPSLLGPPMRKLRVYSAPAAPLGPDWKMIDSIPAGPRGRFDRFAYRHTRGFIVEFEIIPEELSGSVKAVTPYDAGVQATRWALEHDRKFGPDRTVEERKSPGGGKSPGPGRPRS